MDMSEVAKFDVAVGKIKLSEAMRKGAAMVVETTSSYCGCALAAAYIGASGRCLADDAHSKEGLLLDGVGFAADFFGMPYEFSDEIENRHLGFGCPAMTTLQIADWLSEHGL